jgi:hypothetical protein
MKFEVYDIECYSELFLFCGYDIDSKTWVEFHISNFRNDLYAFMNHMKQSGIDYHVSFNGLNYDAQVIQFIIDNYENWVNLSNEQIFTLIKRCSNDIIERGKYELKLPYYDGNFEIKQCDLFKIHHFDNKARRTGLKWLQFSLNFSNVEESPVDFNKKNLTKEDIDLIVKYCKNDVLSSYELFLLTRGQTTNELYKNRDKIQDRLDIISEMGFTTNTMNWSDVKIGDMINLKLYQSLTNKTTKEIYDLKYNRKSRTRFTFGDCIPSYIKFQTKEFNDILSFVKKQVVLLGETKKTKIKKEKGFPFVYNNTVYTIAQGGLHSKERNRKIIPTKDECLMDADIGSQYPNAIIKRKLYPSHLGEKWLIGYSRTRDTRMEDKAKSKDKTLDRVTRNKYEGIAEMKKLALNGGGFGMLNMRDSWQYDPFCAFSCTIGNQFEILMLIEMLELKNIHCISANTDGIVCLFDRSLTDTYYEVCHEWEKIVGNDIIGKLEYTEYSMMIQSSVNDYIAVKIDPKETDPKKLIKKKGDFMTDFEINKNKSRRIIPLAMEKYYIEGIPVEQTIMRHQSIFDFCIGAKASKDYHYESFSRDGKSEVYHRLIRYFISSSGRKIKKIKNPESEAPGNEVTSLEAGGWLCTIANQVDTDDNIRSYGINTKYYIQKTEERIRLIQGYKKKSIPVPKEQLSLF